MVAEPRPRIPRIQRGLLLVLLGAIVGCGGSPSSVAPSADPSRDKLAQITARGTLIAYFAEDYPPQGLLTEGGSRAPATHCPANHLTSPEVTGFDTETSKLVAADLGVEPCFVRPTWTEVTGGNWADHWDIAYGSGSINADRMTRLYMTQPYYAVPNHYFVVADAPYQTAADLARERIGACVDCSHEAFLKGELKIPGVEVKLDVTDPEIVGFQTETPGLQAVAAGEIDAYLAAAPVGQAQIEAGLPLRMLEKPAFTYFPTGFVDRSSSLDVTSFVGRVNAIIRAAHADRRLLGLSMTWFGTDYASAAAAFDLDAIGQTVP